MTTTTKQMFALAPSLRNAFVDTRLIVIQSAFLLLLTSSNASFSSDSLADDDLHHHHVPVSTEVKTSPTGLDQEVWRIQQQDMLKKYLMVAESDLKTKLERVDIKQQRLHLAQDEYNHLNHDLATLSASTTSRKSCTW